MSCVIHQGDALAVLKTLPDASVNCVVTSPPYWGLRDYGVSGQIGLESSPTEYVVRLVEVFREIRRVLCDDGTAWLNLGDSYAGSWGNYHPNSPPGKHGQRKKESERFDRPGYSNQEFLPPTANCPGLKAKDMVGIPWRVAFALQEDGWWLRSDIIWSKPNPMPESVTDRPTKSHEYLFLLAKSERYYFDSEAVKEPAAYLQPNSPESIASPYGQAFTRRAKGNAKTFRGGGKYTGGRSFDNSTEVERDSHGNAPNESLTRNIRSVWTVATEPFPEAHFATFPPKLIEPCVIAGCPAGGTVLDPFAGAGTTGLVAKKHGRNFIGIELNPEYIKMAARRLAQEVLDFG